MKITRKQLRNIILESVNKLLSEQDIVPSGPGGSVGETDSGGGVRVGKQQLGQKLPIGQWETSKHPYGYTLEKAKSYTARLGQVVHWVKGVEGAEKIYVIHKDGVGIGGVSDMSRIPAGAIVLYQRAS